MPVTLGKGCCLLEGGQANLLNAIILHPSRRRRLAGWPAGVWSGFPPRPDSSEKPDFPQKPACLRTWQCTQSDLD